MFNSNAAPSCAQSPRATQRVPAASYDTQQLIATVAAHMNVAPTAITGTARNKEIARARLLVMYVLREDTSATWCGIGRVLRRDHSTVMHGHARIAELVPRDRPLRLTLEAIRSDLRHLPVTVTPPAACARTQAELLEYRYWHMRATRRTYGGASW